MSLVNDMLRDLQRRKQNNVPEGVRIIGGGPPDEGRSGRRSGLILAGLVAAVGLLLAAWWLLGRDGYREVEPSRVEGSPAEVEAPAQTAVTTGTEPESAAPVTLESLEVRRYSNSASIELVLSGDYRHRITNLNSNELNLVIDGAVLAPDFDATDAAVLDGLGIAQQGDSLELRLPVSRPSEFDVQPEAGNRLVIDVLHERSTARNAVSESVPTVDERPPAAPDEAVTGAGDVPAQQETQPAVAERLGVSQETVRSSRPRSLAERDADTRRVSIDLIERGQIVDAYQRLLGFVEANPAAHLSRETLVALLLTRQELAQAETVLAGGLALSPDHAPFRRLQARLMIGQGDLAGALALLQSSPPPLAEDVEYHDLMASLMQQLGQHEDAIAVFQDLLRHRPEQGRWWVAMGISLEELDRGADALGSYRTALRMSDLNEDLRLFSQGRVETLGLRR